MARNVTVIPPKCDFDCGIRSSAGCAETENGGILQGVNRPREQLLSYENHVNYYTNYSARILMYE